jgi:hypothetical protein
MKSVSDSMLQEPVDFKVTVNHKTIWHKLHLRRSERKFILYPLCLGTLLLVAKELSKFDEFTTSGKAIDFDSVVKAIIGNSKILSRVVALALWNKRFSNNEIVRRIQENHIKKLSEYIEGNLDSSEILVLCNAVINQMEIEHFLACMGSMRGMEVVKDQAKPVDSIKETSGE